MLLETPLHPLQNGRGEVREGEKDRGIRRSEGGGREKERKTRGRGARMEKNSRERENGEREKWGPGGERKEESTVPYT